MSSSRPSNRLRWTFCSWHSAENRIQIRSDDVIWKVIVSHLRNQRLFHFAVLSTAISAVTATYATLLLTTALQKKKKTDVFRPDSRTPTTLRRFWPKIRKKTGSWFLSSIWLNGSVFCCSDGACAKKVLDSVSDCYRKIVKMQKCSMNERKDGC